MQLFLTTRITSFETGLFLAHVSVFYHMPSGYIQVSAEFKPSIALTVTVPPTRRLRAHHRVNPYPGACR